MIIDFQSAAQFNTTLLVSHSRYDGSALLDIANDWVQRQGEEWPAALTGEKLIDNMDLAYVALWVVSGEGSASWSATIGREERHLVLCPTCKGSGSVVHPDGRVEMCAKCNGSRSVEEVDWVWSSQHGIVSHDVHNHLEINVKRRFRPPFVLRGNLSAANSISPADAAPYQVLPPENVLTEAGHAVLEDMLKVVMQDKARHSANQLGSVSNLHVAYVTVNRAEIKTWLYPMYIGTYTHEGELLLVWIDGLTGTFWAEPPQAVRSVRRSRLLRWVAIVVFILGLLLMLWWLYHWM